MKVYPATINRRAVMFTSVSILLAVGCLNHTNLLPHSQYLRTIYGFSLVTTCISVFWGEVGVLMPLAVLLGLAPIVFSYPEPTHGRLMGVFLLNLHICVSLLPAFRQKIPTDKGAVTARSFFLLVSAVGILGPLHTMGNESRWKIFAFRSLACALTLITYIRVSSWQIVGLVAGSFALLVWSVDLGASMLDFVSIVVGSMLGIYAASSPKRISETLDSRTLWWTAVAVGSSHLFSQGLVWLGTCRLWDVDAIRLCVTILRES